MHNCMRKIFKPRSLFFQPRPFKAHFLAKNKLLCGSIDLFMIENEAKVSCRSINFRLHILQINLQSVLLCISFFYSTLIPLHILVPAKVEAIESCPYHFHILVKVKHKK